MKHIRSLLTAVLAAVMLASASTPALAAEDAAREGDFFDDLRSLWQSASQGVAKLGETAGQLRTEGTEALAQRLDAWSAEVDAYLDEHSAQWSQDIQDAWNTLREAAENAVNSEEAAEAYQRLQTWLAQAGETVDEGMDVLLEGLGRAAGVIQDETTRWIEQVDATLSECPPEEDEVQTAWTLLRTGVEHPGLIAEEEMLRAKAIVREWLDGLDAQFAEPAREALEGLTPEETAAPAGE